MKQQINFPRYSGLRCLMMPYVQGEPASVPDCYAAYSEVIEAVFLRKGEVGYLTIDESPVAKGTAHRGNRAKYARALHTEAGIVRNTLGWGSPGWGTPTWGGRHAVTLDRGVQILLANNLDNSCAIWPSEHEDTSADGDIGHHAQAYPYDSAIFMKAGEVHQIGILTPHESIPVPQAFNRQFLRIVGSGVHGREEYFTKNPLMRLT